MQRTTRQPRHPRTVVLLALLISTTGAFGEGPLPRRPAWIPDDLRQWQRGAEMLQGGRSESGLREFLSLRAERPTDPCGFYFVALTYSAFEVGGLEREARRERSRILMAEGIATAEAELKKRPKDLSMRYCLGALYGLQARDRLARSQQVRAAFDAKRSRRIMLDLLADAPRFQDCRFWTGSYDYFVAALPSAAKFFRALLFIPGGDRERGLQALEETARLGNLERFKSYAVLRAAYTRFEKDPVRAREVMERFHRSFPASPEVTLELAEELTEGNSGQRERAISLLKTLRDQVRRGAIEGGQRLVDRTLVALSQAFLADLNPWPMVGDLRGVVERATGDGPRERAAVSMLVPVLNLAGLHEEGLQAALSTRRRYPDEAWTAELVTRAQVYDQESSRVESLLLPARRIGAGGALPEAEVEYRRVMAQVEAKGLPLYRMAETWFLAARDQEAMAGYHAVIELSEPFPRFAVPRSHLRIGNILDIRGDRTGARSQYRLALKSGRDVPGVESDAKTWLDRPFDPEEERK